MKISDRVRRFEERRWTTSVLSFIETQREREKKINHKYNDDGVCVYGEGRKKCCFSFVQNRLIGGKSLEEIRDQLHANQS